jgi:Leucine-rich repeat (LRR) protein
MPLMAKVLSILKPKRSWLQYRLRTMFVLVVVVAVPCDWLAWKREAKRKERAAVAAIEKLGGVVFYHPDQSPPPLWLRWLFGDSFFIDVDMVHLAASHKSDAAMNHLKGMDTIRTLILTSSQITDHGLSCAKRLSELQNLSLEDTQITDSGLKHLGKLTSLESLLLSHTPITDSGLKHVYGLIGLKDLEIYGTEVTDAGVSDLQKALPLCQIHR